MQESRLGGSTVLMPDICDDVCVVVVVCCNSDSDIQ